MSRIGASLSGIEQFLLNAIANSTKAANVSAKRLATGKNYNSPSDGPSAYLTVSKLETQLSDVQRAKTRVTTAASIAAQAQQSLDSIETQLNTIRTTLLTDETQTLTAAQRSSAQLTIDTAITQINSLAATSINGERVLDGSKDYSLAGNNTSQIRDIQVFSTNGTTISGSVTSTATRASQTYTGAGSRTTAAATITLTGARGSASFTIANNTNLTTVSSAINQMSHRTGITTTAVGNNLTFTTVDYGSAANLNIAVTSGTFTTAGTTAGTDATATINGRAYTGAGNRFDFNDNGLHAVVDFVAGFTGAFSSVTTTPRDVLRFALSTDTTNITKLGLTGVQAASFRGLSGSLDQLASSGSLSGLNGNTSAAIRVIDEALSKLTIVQGQVDGFANASVASASAVLSSFETTLTDSIESINTVDEDAENILLTRNQSLASTGSAAITLLQQQQSSMLQILQQLAGLS